MDYKFLEDFSVCFLLENIENDEEAFLLLLINFGTKFHKNQWFKETFSKNHFNMLLKYDLKLAHIHKILDSLWSACKRSIFSGKKIYSNRMTELNLFCSNYQKSLNS